MTGNKSNNDDGVDVSLSIRNADDVTKKDGACPQQRRTSLLADGMRNLILDYGVDACQEQLDAYRAESAAAAVYSGGGGCPIAFINNNKKKEKVAFSRSPLGSEEEEKQEEDGCSGRSGSISSIKRNSLDDTGDDKDAMERLVESRNAAQSLAFHLEHDAQLNHDIIEASFDGVFLVNDFGIIRMVNGSALAKFGYSHASELVGRNIRVICGHEHANMHDQYMERYRLTRESRMIGSQREVQARRKDGSEFPCKIGIKVMEREGSNELLMVGFVRDLTWEKRTTSMIIEAKIAENLLVNMLPHEIAMRLKSNGDPHCQQQLVADHHDSATILFADIVGAS
jgi:PAS domain S-box-containing protein